MGSSGGFDPGSILTNLIISTITGSVQGANSGGGGGSAAQAQAQAEAQRQADEQDAKARRAEDRRAEEAVLKAQAQKQKLASGGIGSASSTLGDGGSLAGQSAHGSAAIAAPQLKEKLGQ